MVNMKDINTWEDFFYNDECVSPEEREKAQFESDLIGKLIEARELKGYSQRDLAKISGIKQPAIARMESMKSVPKIDTLMKILIPLGYTLAIVPLSNAEKG